MFWNKRKRIKATELGKDDFEIMVQEENLVFVFFEAPWCGACKMLHPILDDLADENKDNPVTIAVVNTDKEKELSSRHHIRSLPTLVVFHHQEIVHQGPGMISKPRLQEMIHKLISKEKTES